MHGVDLKDDAIDMAAALSHGACVFAGCPDPPDFLSCRHDLARPQVRAAQPHHEACLLKHAGGPHARTRAQIIEIKQLSLALQGNRRQSRRPAADADAVPARRAQLVVELRARAGRSGQEGLARVRAGLDWVRVQREAPAAGRV